MPPVDPIASADLQAKQMLANLPIKDPAASVVIIAARAAHHAAQEARRARMGDPPIDVLFSPFTSDPSQAIQLLDIDAAKPDVSRLQHDPIDSIPLPFDFERAALILESVHGEDCFAVAASQGGHVGDPARVADVRAFEAARDVVEKYSPLVLCAGEEDGQTPEGRAKVLLDAIAAGRPWLVMDPIDGTLGYRRTRMSDCWCSAVMAQFGESFATCITTASVTLLTWNDDLCLYWAEGGWRLVQPKAEGERTDGFGLILPTLKAKDRRKYASVLLDPLVDVLYGFSGNPAILEDVLLGFVDAALQPSCMSWDVIVAHAAAIADLNVLRLDTGIALDASEVRQMLVSTLLDAEKMPDIAITRDEAATQMLLRVLPVKIGKTA
jgi:hypothetical protein